jgi:N-acetylmuramoyl-L-alanine amidase
MLSRRDALKSVAAIASSPLIPQQKGPSQSAARSTVTVGGGSEAGSVGKSVSRFGVDVKPRSAWVPAKQAAPQGLSNESEVKVLLVHHSDSLNSYQQDGVPGLLRGFLGFHTGPEKKWPDVAYNFFVDRFGGVWEGRSGSLDGPVAGSATGGNQGYSQLVCLVGTFQKEAPPTAMLDSLIKVLAGLESHYSMSADPEATTTFVSKGSNRWPAGKKVIARSIEGHRTMSQTTCPGDAGFAALPGVRLGVQKLRKK